MVIDQLRSVTEKIYITFASLDMPTDDAAKDRASKILGSSNENAFLQSFVRVDAGADDKHGGRSSRKRSNRLHVPRQVSFDIPDGEHRDRNSSPRPAYSTKLSGKAIFKQIKKEMKEKEIKSRRVHKEEEVYTDKDRAAAVNMGSTDIKHSLSKKLRQDRSKALQLPDEADPNTLMALGRNELRAGNTEIALSFVNKALDLNPDDQTALVARSKCYLLIGEPKLALEDAETALLKNKNYIKAIYQKAEALYYLGDFELSLMFYHRGLRIRPELEGFRLGVQKAQEAIENTIGSSKPLIDLKDIEESLLSASVQDDKNPRKSITPTKRNNSSRKATNPEKKLSRQLLGQLCVDKEYLEKLLKHPDLNVADRKTNSITAYAEEAVQFLNKRQEFWRQQRPTATAAGKRKTSKLNDLGPFPKWYDQNHNI